MLNTSIRELNSISILLDDELLNCIMKYDRDGLLRAPIWNSKLSFVSSVSSDINVIPKLPLLMFFKCIAIKLVMINFTDSRFKIMLFGTECSITSYMIKLCPLLHKLKLFLIILSNMTGIETTLDRSLREIFFWIF